MVNAQRGLDLGIVDDVVFGEFLHAEGGGREVNSSAYLSFL